MTGTDTLLPAEDAATAGGVCPPSEEPLAETGTVPRPRTAKKGDSPNTVRLRRSWCRTTSRCPEPFDKGERIGG